MTRRMIGSVVQIAFLTWFVSSAVPAWVGQQAAAREPRYGDRWQSVDLLAWQERLARFDDAAPKSKLLAVETLIAYEENPHFAYALGENATDGEVEAPLRFRRVLLIKPDTLVVDDLYGSVKSTATIRRVGWPAETVAVTSVGFIPRGFMQNGNWQDTNDPVGDLPATTAEEAGSDNVASTKPPQDELVRIFTVFQIRGTDEAKTSASFKASRHEKHWRLSIRRGDGQFLVELPRRYLDTGWIATSPPGNTTLSARRPLPAGILPHGEQGIGLIERWDRSYRGDRRPAWDTGTPAEDLKRAVEQGDVQPCRTVVLGCGSGTNAIYLASKGFDVTAIDVAPTALGIADTKAQKAGVRVRWLLADVLKLPDLGTFDLIFDRGCYHNVRYVDATGFVASLRQLSHTGTKFLVLSLNRDGPPGVREPTMRDDLSSLFNFVWLKESEIQTGADGGNQRASWSVMLQRKAGP